MSPLITSARLRGRPIDVERPPQEAVELLKLAVTRAKRTSVRLPQAFARDRVSAAPTPPLSALLYGGGEVRIKVLLTVLMIATKPPHDTRISSKDLAAMLNLPAPDDAGARRVSKAFGDLARANLVRRVARQGHVPDTVVLDPGGTGEQWSDRELPQGYISLPAGLWERGWIIALSGRAIALLIILRELTHGRPAGGTYVDSIRKRQYGLSDDTWTKGTKELVEAGLLDIVEKVESFKGEPRRRNLYTLHLSRVSSLDPGQVGQGENGEES